MYFLQHMSAIMYLCQHMSTTVSRKAGRSLTLLVIWELWKERNARVFWRREASTLTLMTNIKAEAAAWTLAGAKDLALLLWRE